MGVLATVAYPLVWILTRSTDAVFRLLRLRDSGEPRVTEEEISHLLHEGAEAGVIQRAEHALVERVFRFADRDVGLVMTPRVEIEFLDLEAPAHVNREKLIAARRVRLVVCRGGLDRAEGVIDVRDLLAEALAGKPLDLEGAMRPVHFVPEHVPAMRVLEHLRRTGQRLAVVLDEYGGTAGVVTADDLLEALVGPIADTDGSSSADMIVDREDGSVLVDGQVTADELKERLRLDELAGEEDGDFRTAAGWVVTRLGRIPDVGDYFEAHGLRVEVVDMDGPRVDRLLITPVEGAGASGVSPVRAPANPSESGAW
jgi:putative hemolysin